MARVVPMSPPAGGVRASREELERGVLSLLLRNPQAAEQALELIPVTHPWCRPEHAAVHQAAVMLRAQGVVVDALAVAELIERAPELPRCPPAVVDEIAEEALPIAEANLGYHVGVIVREAAQERARRQLEGVDASDPRAAAHIREIAHELENATAAHRAPPSVTVEDLEAAEVRRVDWCIRGLIERGQIAFLVASSKTGKTSLLYHAAVAAALGRPIGGLLSVTGPHLVVLVDQENPRPSALRRLRALGGEDAIRSGRLHFVHRPGVRLDTPDGLAPLRAKLRELRAERSLAELPLLLILDSWARTAGELDENANGERLERVARLIEFCHEHAATALVAANPSRGDTKRVRGGVAIEDQLDALLSLTKHDDGRRTLSVALARGDAELVGELEVTREQLEADGPIEITLDHVHPEPERLDETDLALLRALRAPGVDGPTAAAEFAHTTPDAAKKRGGRLERLGMIRRQNRTWTLTPQGEDHIKVPNGVGTLSAPSPTNQRPGGAAA